VDAIMSMGWPFWTVAIVMGAWVLYVVGANLLDAVIRNWNK
jgi:hypothetical protein